MNDINRKKKIHRGFLRRSASTQVKITCRKREPSDGGPNLTTVVLDLSEAGARLLVAAPLEIGEDVVLQLEGPLYQSPVTRYGKVVWSFQVTKEDYAVGLRLEECLDGEEIEKATIQPMRLDY